MIVLSALGLYTIPAMAFPLTAFGVWLLLSWLWKDVDPVYGVGFIKYLLLFGLLTAILTLIFYAPVFLVSGSERIFGNNPVTPLDWGEFTSRLSRRLEHTWTVFNKGVPALLTWVLIAGFGLALLARRKITQQKVPFPMVIVLACGTLMLLFRIVPFDRVWLFAIPVFLIWASAGLNLIFDHTIGSLLQRWPVVLVISKVSLFLLLCLPLAWGGHQYHQKRAASEAYAQEIALFLDEYLAPGDVVVMAFPIDAPIRYYLDLYQTNSGSLYAYQSGEFAEAVVIVNEGSGQTPESVLVNQNFPLELLDISSARQIYQLRGISLYAMERQ
jgi:hypothetical protein